MAWGKPSDSESLTNRVKMITGYHAVTATAIAAQINIGNDSVLIGAELDRMTYSEPQRLSATSMTLLATSPENKLRLVTALQADGHVLAMTDDGVNDAPALKRADVGVARVKSYRGRRLGNQRNGVGG